jgi:hypothetical protein
MTEIDDLREAGARKLDGQAQRARRYQEYYDCEAGIVALLDTEERQTFRTFLRESGANFCELIVNAVAERLTVTGFRFAGADADAWAIWQASHMDADSQLAQIDALITGSGFVLVQPDDDNPTGVEMTVESPLEACVLYEPGSRRRRAAGYKRYTDDAGQTHTEVLITPDQIITWLPRTGPGGPMVEDNPAGEVGLVELRPQPQTSRPPRSELASAISIQDRIHTTIFNRLVATDYGAFRQIWATGIKVAQQVIKGENGDTVRVVRPFDIGANRLLTNENPDGHFGHFPESGLKGYLDSVEQDANHLAAISQTPPHYLLATVANLSADAIKAAEAGLVSKTSRRQLFLGEDYEDAMRIGLRITGNPAAADVEAEVLWRDPETRSLGQLVDSLVKMRTLGVPLEVLWERYGASPQEIKRWLALAAAERAAAPAPAPEGVPA